MKLLLVEDDPNKASRISDALSSFEIRLEVDHARSYKSGLLLLVENTYSLVVADMTLPMFDADESDPSGFRVEHFGGKHLLREMALRGIEFPTIVLTQFDVLGPPEESMTLPKLDEELSAEFDGFYHGAIFYKASEQQWKVDLETYVNRFCNK